jgi:excisionase family DNA binding protein
MSTLPQLTRDDVLDGRQVAELLHLPSSTVLEYARRGVIPAHKLGRRWVFIRDELAAALRAVPQTEPRRSHPSAQPRRDTGPGAQLALPFENAA